MPASTDWRGAFAAVVTPFTRDGELDLRALRANVEMTVGDGTHGLMVGGQYGEGNLLSEAEKETLFAVASETVNGRIPVIAATGQISTAATIALTRAAQRAGADGVMIDPPIYIQPKAKETFGHFARIADAVDIPIMLCNTPYRVGVDLDLPLLARLLEIPSIVAIKHSGTDVQRVIEMVETFQDRLKVFIGPARLFGFYGVLMGAAGFLDGLIQVIGRKPVEMYEAAVARDLDRGLALQRELFHFGEIIYSKEATSPATTKEAMRMLGRPGGWPRAPLHPLGPAARQRLADKLKGMGLSPSVTVPDESPATARNLDVQYG